MDRKLPEGFASWNQLYRTVTKLFPHEEIGNDFTIAIVNEPGMEKHLEDIEWIKAHSDKVIFLGELKAFAFDELSGALFDADELLLLRAVLMRALNGPGILGMSTETLSEMIDKVNKQFNLHTHKPKYKHHDN
jgi:hypothetical protein